MNSNLGHSFPTSLLLQHLKDLDVEYLWHFWHDVRACEAENELLQPIIPIQTTTEVQPRDGGGSGRHKPLQAPLCCRCTDVSGALGNWNKTGTSPSLPTRNPASDDSKAGFQPHWHCATGTESSVVLSTLFYSRRGVIAHRTQTLLKSGGGNLGNTCAEPAPGSSPSHSLTWRSFLVPLVGRHKSQQESFGWAEEGSRCVFSSLSQLFWPSHLWLLSDRASSCLPLTTR